jgi:hypothetical protein
LKTLIGVLFALLLSPQSTANLTGKWDVVVSIHGPGEIVLQMKQDGTKVMANFMIADHGDLEMSGEFLDGRLTLNTTENAFAQMTLYGRLKEDGTLAGSATSAMGDMTWTATRSSN